MPRAKTIDLNKIYLEKLVQKKHLDIIEKKDCLSVGLTFNTPFTDEQWSIIEKRFNFTVYRSSCTIYRNINNSWKGLVMALLSLSYCKHGDETVKRFWDSKYIPKSTKSKSFHSIGRNMRIDFNYEQLLDRETKSQINAGYRRKDKSIPIDKFLEYFNEPEDIRERRANEIYNKVMTELISKLPPDNRIEEIAWPESRRSLYIKAIYEAGDIQEYIVLLNNMLDLDMAKSFVETQYSKELPHKYNVATATPKYCGSPLT